MSSPATNHTPRRRSEKAAAAMLEICSVRLGQALYGVPISHILEIVGRHTPSPFRWLPGLSADWCTTAVMFLPW